MPIMKVPDSILDKISCRCGLYLSKLPIKIQDGESICKDCADEQSSSPVAVARNTPYEALASLFAFPCRYKHQGCPRYAKLNELDSHEAECSYRVHECPVNLYSSCNWKGTVTQLREHYQERHPELFLEAPVFRIKVDEDFEMYYLIDVDEMVLLLQCKCVVKESKLWFNMVCFKQADSAAGINYEIKLSNVGNPGRVMKFDNLNPLSVMGIQMIPEKCQDVSIPSVLDFLKQPEVIECKWNITVSCELKRNIENQQKLEQKELFEARNERIKCFHCGIYMTPPIFCCTSGHITCVDCKGYYNECKDCQKNEVNFTIAVDLEEISRAEQHYCRWINCKKEFSSNEIREHEQSCLDRLYNCPKCNIWSGILENLLHHLRSVHPEIEVKLSPSFSFDLHDYISTYVIALREIFKVVVSKQILKEGCVISRETNVDVWYLGVPFFANQWQYKITGNNSAYVISPFTKYLNHQNSTIVAPAFSDNATSTTSTTTVTTSGLGSEQSAISSAFGSSLSGEKTNSSNVTQASKYQWPFSTQDQNVSLFGIPATSCQSGSSNFGNPSIFSTASSIFGGTCQQPKKRTDIVHHRRNATFSQPGFNNSVKNVSGVNTADSNIQKFTLTISKTS